MQVYVGIWSLSWCYDRVWLHRTRDQTFCRVFRDCQILLTLRTSASVLGKSQLTPFDQYYENGCDGRGGEAKTSQERAIAE